ncbi:xanthine dehydrogenase family protein molybdopterin-binding subunit [Paraflavitalea sp. CAU 1676]|uniref:xanthine dehydrogenase family protein molybdopterin-binding subunit n=1 Tax=Paraflavitalea sp. CAU 1676 TaxID=3032598 RepID=UPI0023D98FBA|nr:xanthine dehydrogenase family protein molybdopterin-binding subunit [Paraflavitalea sp. CAU 1676]MDF2188848.1 xanthine dehydrogenase family protein molybdopterin-binding subunit [Paraflavitalea sp. CAU 1676]
MNNPSTVSRRKFLQTTTTFAGGLLIPFFVSAGAKRMGMLGALGAAEAAGADSAVAFAPNAYLGIGRDNSVHIILAHVEMGQGVWTTLPMLIADELDCDWNKIKVGHAPPAQPYYHTMFGIQITGGSSTTWSEFDRYRQAGATARAVMVAAAAQQWGVAPEACSTADGYVIYNDKKLSYGELADAAAKIPPPANVPLKPASEWKYIGKGVKRLDTSEKINGKARFGMDVQFPGLLTAVIARPPVFGAQLKRFDAAKAKTVAGVRQVVAVPSGVAVIADHFWAAKQGREALVVEWDIEPSLQIDTPGQWAAYRGLTEQRGAVAAKAGDAQDALSKAADKVDVEYTLPYLAHACMEPLNCTVKIANDKCEIWTGTQMPGLDQGAAAKILGFKPEQVEVHTMFLGGGFGRRATAASDFVSEAVEVAKASGKAVKTVWTREDDIRGGYYRPAFLHRVRVGLGEDKMPVAWHHSIVGQSILAGTPFEAGVKDGIDGASVEGVNDSPYMGHVPNHLIELHSPKNKIPVLWWRSVGHTHTAFVMETMIDQLAHSAGKDPVEYRRTLLKDHKRPLSALNLAAEKAGWGTPLPAGHFRGIAVHDSFGSAVAQVAEVSVEKGKVRVHRVVCAIDCGLAVNPDGVAAQMESGIIFGLTAFLYGNISLDKGRVRQGNFHDYKMVRMQEAPAIEVFIVPSTEKMGGAGEPGVPPLAPAVANALFAATGKRIRNLPVKPEDLS